MNFKTQLMGLTTLLTTLAGAETRLSTLLAQLGFTSDQITLLRDQHLAPIVMACLTALQERLAAHAPQGRLYTVLCRRYGLDGYDPDPVRVLADQLGVSPDQIHAWETKALGICGQAQSQKLFTAQLHRVALAQLGALNARPAVDQIQSKLDRLAEVRVEADRTRQAYTARRMEILRTVQDALDALDAEYHPLFTAIDEGVAQLEDEIKNDVLLHGATVQSASVRAVYSKGRVSWDTKALTRYADSHAELLECRRQGAPTVSLRLLSPTPDAAASADTGAAEDS